MPNVIFNLLNATSSVVTSRKVTLTPWVAPKGYGHKTLVDGQFTGSTDSSGNLSFALVPDIYKVQIDKTSEPFYINVPTSSVNLYASALVVSGSTPLASGSATVLFDLVYGNTTDVASRNVTVTPYVATDNPPTLVSQSIITTDAYKFCTNTTGDFTASMVQAGVYRVDVAGVNAATKYYIQVPTASGVYNAEDLRVDIDTTVARTLPSAYAVYTFYPKETIDNTFMKLDGGNFTASYISSSAIHGTVPSATTASYARSSSFAQSSSFAKSASYALNSNQALSAGIAAELLPGGLIDAAELSTGLLTVNNVAEIGQLETSGDAIIGGTLQAPNGEFSVLSVNSASIVDLTVTHPIHGTASFASSASYALSSSKALSSNSASFAVTASNAITASFYGGSVSSASYSVSSSIAVNALTASKALNANTASYVTNAISSSYINGTGGTLHLEQMIVQGQVLTDAISFNNVSDITLSAETPDNNIIITNGGFKVQYNATGTDIFTVNGNTGIVSASIVTATLHGTASIANTASFVSSASYALSSSKALSSNTASIANTASFYGGSVVSSSYAATASVYNGSVVSASFAQSSSIAAVANTASFYGGSVTSASYSLTASRLNNDQTYLRLGELELTNKLSFSDVTNITCNGLKYTITTEDGGGPYYIGNHGGFEGFHGNLHGTASYATTASYVTSASFASVSPTSSYGYNSGSMVITSDTQTLITTKTSTNRAPLPIFIVPGVTNQSIGAAITMSAGFSTNGAGGNVEIQGGVGIGGIGGDVNLWAGNGSPHGTVNIKGANGTTRFTVSGSRINVNGTFVVSGSVNATTYQTPISSSLWGASVTIDLNSTSSLIIPISGSTAFTSSNRQTGVSKTVTLALYGYTSDQNLTFESGWNWLVATPTKITANKKALLTVTSMGSATSDIFAAYKESV